MKIYSKLFLASFLTLLACLGFGRFAFGMIIPNMQENLQISTTIIGFISSANFLGYFIGIIFAPKIYSKFKTSSLLFSLIILQALSMILMTLLESYYSISTFYLLSGFFAAISNISIMVYISHTVPKEIRGKALGIAVSGNGVAIILSGFLVPYLENFYDSNSWRVSWLLFSLTMFALAFIIKSLLVYEDKKPANSDLKFHHYFKIANFWKIAILYFLFGLTYVVYVTYFVSAAEIKWQLSSNVSGLFWSTFGFICIFGGFIFGMIADKYGTFKSLILVFLFQAISMFILLFNIPKSLLFLSIFFFAISVWSVPTMIAMLCTEFFGLEKTSQVFSLATLTFALGQILGPICAGYFFDKFNSFDIVFLLIFIFSFIAFLLVFFFSIKRININ